MTRLLLAGQPHASVARGEGEAPTAPSLSKRPFDLGETPGHG
jgi:hypothetical protein